MTIPRGPSDNVRYRRSQGNGTLLLAGKNTVIFQPFRTQSPKKTTAYRETSASSRRLARTAHSILTLKQHESPGQSP